MGKIFMEQVFKIPKDEIYWCHSYPPYLAPTNMPPTMINVNMTKEFAKKIEPPAWPEKNPNPCYTKHHAYQPIDLKYAPQITEEQGLEFMRKELYTYYSKISDVKSKFLSETIKEKMYGDATMGYMNVRFMPMVWPSLSNEIHDSMNKVYHFQLTLFYADYMAMGLEQLLIDQTMLGNPMVKELQELYALHLRLRCIIWQTISSLHLSAAEYVPYSNMLPKFRFRDTTSPLAANLRSWITIRSAYYYAFFVYDVLYWYRFNPIKGARLNH